MCPTPRKCREMDLCWPVSTLQAQYHNMKRFLFWPAQLSQCRLASVSPNIYLAKIKSRNEIAALDPFDTRCASSMRKLTCFGMSSQHTHQTGHNSWAPESTVIQAASGCWADVLAGHSRSVTMLRLQVSFALSSVRPDETAIFWASFTMLFYRDCSNCTTCRCSSIWRIFADFFSIWLVAAAVDKCHVVLTVPTEVRH